MGKNKKLKTIIILSVILLVIGVTFAVIINGEGLNIFKGDDVVLDEQQVAQLEFSMKFLQLENDKQNMIYSPLSIKYALRMLSEGAEGDTKVQIDNVIGKLNLTNYNNIDDVLSLANSIYVRDTYAEAIKEEYKRILTEKYSAEVNYDSFNNADNINSWIENKTLGIIKNMLSDNKVQNPDTKMFLINVLAIDMAWKDSFESQKTEGADFYLEDGSKMEATTMHLETFKDTVSYYKGRNVIALTMNLKEYNDVQLEFVAIMPKKNLSEYIKNFSADEFYSIMGNLKLASETKNGVEISIPRFSFDYELNLEDDLKKLGIVDAFDENLANFSNMSDTTELYVGDALHKATIDFKESGIKAAAATVFSTLDGVAMSWQKSVEISIDKPFMYVIRDKNTGEIWFVGTVYEPNSWEDDKTGYNI